MFKKKKDEHKRRRRSGGFGPFRILLSLFMVSILALGVYSAYKSFSGLDPLNISPRVALRSVVNYDSALSFLGGLLSFSPTKVIHKSDPSGLTLGAEAEATPRPTPKPILDYRFAVMADSEDDNVNLKKGLDQAKENNAKFIINLGDDSQVGTVDELSAVKKQFDTIGIPVYPIPGDHDLWDSRNRGLSPISDFTAVFGLTFQSFSFNNSRFIMVDNSDNYTGVSDNQMSWLKEQLDKGRTEKAKDIFVFLSTPLYHPSSDHVMGDVTPALKVQSDNMIKLFEDYGVKESFAGDTHFFASYSEPKSELHMTAVGAVTADRNLEDPRYIMVDVYKDGSYNITDTAIK